MFIYAAASALSSQECCTCISSFENLGYFKIPVWKKILNFFRWYFILSLRKLKLLKLYDFKNGWVTHTSKLAKLEVNAIITGYFQGLQYFQSFQNDIRKKFEVKNKYFLKYNSYIKQFGKKKIVAIQIRRTDYLFFNDSDLMGPDLTLPLSYYNNLISELRNKDGFQFIVMGDDKQYLHDHFEGFSDVAISECDEITDLQILIYADVCVISASSFGWWGAWLNSNPEKEVYLPEFYLGFKVGKEYPVGIIPEGWNKVKISSL